MVIELDLSSKSASLVSLGKFFNLFEAQFSRPYNGDTSEDVVRSE